MLLVYHITYKIFHNRAFQSETAFIPCCVKLLSLNICLLGVRVTAIKPASM